MCVTLSLLLSWWTGTPPPHTFLSQTTTYLSTKHYAKDPPTCHLEACYICTCEVTRHPGYLDADLGPGCVTFCAFHPSSQSQPFSVLLQQHFSLRKQQKGKMERPLSPCAKTRAFSSDYGKIGASCDLNIVVNPDKYACFMFSWFAFYFQLLQSSQFVRIHDTTSQCFHCYHTFILFILEVEITEVRASVKFQDVYKRNILELLQTDYLHTTFICNFAVSKT